MSQRRSSPTGFFSPAEDKLKLSDDVIEDNFISTLDSGILYFSSIRWRSAEDGGQRAEDRGRRSAAFAVWLRRAGEDRRQTSEIGEAIDPFDPFGCAQGKTSAQGRLSIALLLDGLARSILSRE